MYQEKKFRIPALSGISEKTTETHLKLYSAYVKNTNAVIAAIKEAEKNPTENTPILAGLYRRLSFEWNGMRNHEIFFSQFEDGGQLLPDSTVVEAIKHTFGSFEIWSESIKSLAANRGVGWAVLYYDRKENKLFNSWIEEQHIGVHTNAEPLIMLDVWEHAFILDFAPAEKMKYIEAFFSNINWAVIEERFSLKK